MTARHPRTRTEQSALLTLGALLPRVPVDAALPRLATVTPELTAHAIERHKVVRLATRRLRAHASTDTPTSEWAERTAEILAPREAVIAERARVRPELLRELGDLGEELGVPILGIKGVATRELFDSDGDRDAGDVDLLIADHDDAWQLAIALRRRAFKIDAGEVPWVKRAPDGRRYGQIRLSCDGHPGRSDIDIHYGRFSVRHCGSMRVEALAGAPPGLTSLDLSSNLALLVADAAGDYFVSMKSANDLWLTLAREDFHEGRFLRMLDEGILRGFLARMLRTLEAVMVPLPVPRRFGATAPEPPPPVFPLRNKAQLRLRTFQTTRHAFRVGRSESPAAAVRNALTAYLAYRKDVALRVTGRRAPVVRVASARPDRCVRLLPASELAPDDAGDGGGSLAGAGDWRPLDGSPFMRVASTARGDLVSDGHERFVPTVSYRVPAALVSAARSAGT